MAIYPEIIIDKETNAPISMNASFTTEYRYDFLHHTHKLSDIVDDSNKSEEVESAYDDSELRKLVETQAAEIDVLRKRVFELEKKERFKIAGTPAGTLVSYQEKEIRIMCPSNTEWKLQQVGENGNPNIYYMSFKAYAPDGAVSFKEGDRGVIVDEMHTFDESFAGTDKDGRNYSICWLALASYNSSTDTWAYYGANSSTKKYIGWDYVVEWYDADGVLIATDSIRINLSNESCHLVNEPYYVSKIMAEIESIKEKL